jgi:WD40 repeat protein
MVRLSLVFGLLLVSLNEVKSETPRVRADELPPGAVARLGTLRLRHGEAVVSLAFAADGKTLASAGESGSVRLWEIAGGRQLREFPAGTGSLVRFSSDGKHLVCAGSEDGLSLRDAVSGKIIRRFPAGQRSNGDAFVALAPDGKTLAAPAGNEVILWDTDSGKERRRLKGHTSPVLSVAFSPDGKLLAAGDDNQGHQTTLLLWEVDSGKEVAYIAGANQSWTYGLAFAPDGKTLASSSPYETYLWELATRKRPLKFEKGARSLAYSPDGKLLAVAEYSDSGFIHLLDAAKGKEVRTLRGHTGSVNAVAFAPKGKVLASGGRDGTVRLWDAASGREIIQGPGHAVEIRAAAFAPDGKRVATASGADHTIRIWNSTGGAPLLTIDIPCVQHSWLCPSHHADLLAFEPGGKTLLCDDNVFDAASGRRIARLAGAALAVSADGKLLAGASDIHHGIGGAQVSVWQRTNGRETAHFAPFAESGGLSQLTAAAFSTDGRILAVGAANYNVEPGEPAKETVFLYDLAAGKLLRKLRPSIHRPAFLAFSPDGSLLATSAFWDAPVQLWRVVDGSEVRKLSGHEDFNHGTEERPMAFSPSGKFLASAGKNNTVVLWETMSGQEVHRLTGHRGTIRALAFAPDGRTLLSAGADTTALLWSLAPSLPKNNLDAEEALRRWRELASEDAAVAYRAAWHLARQPNVNLPLLKKHWHPLREPDPRQIAKLILDLDADEFTIRQAAFEKLRQLRSTAEPALRTELTSKPTLEARKRIEDLLAQLQRQPIPAEELRQLRAVQVLEWMKTPAADALIERLAGGSPLLRTTRDAKDASRRRNIKR